MSYVYLLVKLADPPAASLRELVEERTCDWLNTMEEVREQLGNLYPSARWEYRECDHKGEYDPTIKGYVLDMGSRFELLIQTRPFHAIMIDGSHHVDQAEEVIKIARLFNLSAFDIQSGEVTFMQQT